MKKMFIIFFSVVTITLFSQISLDLNLHDLEIPITGQTFAVLVVAYVFGWKMGVISVLVYLILGVFGLPVFADGKSGLDVMMGNSGGFLMGFVAGAFVSGKVSQRFENNWFYALFAMLVGTIVIIFSGVLRLSLSFGIEKALVYGFYPFWIGGLVKVILGGVVAWLLKGWFLGSRQSLKV